MMLKYFQHRYNSATYNFVYNCSHKRDGFLSHQYHKPSVSLSPSTVMIKSFLSTPGAAREISYLSSSCLMIGLCLSLIAPHDGLAVICPKPRKRSSRRLMPVLLYCVNVLVIVHPPVLIISTVSLASSKNYPQSKFFAFSFIKLGEPITEICSPLASVIRENF